MSATPTHTIFHISDSALTIDFGNQVSENLNRIVLALFDVLQKNPLPGMIEAVPAYSSLTVYYDLFQLRKKIPADKTVSEWMEETIGSIISDIGIKDDHQSRTVTVPVCYELPYALDLEAVAISKQMGTEEVIQLHKDRVYRVHMLGFLPGFAYMGELDERISMPRKTQPVPVVAGSVGIVGFQTGIYPMASPGGWSIIGRTPLTLFDIDKDGLTLLNAGDQVKFIAISKDEFENY